MTWLIPSIVLVRTNSLSHSNALAIEWQIEIVSQSWEFSSTSFHSILFAFTIWRTINLKLSNRWINYVELNSTETRTITRTSFLVCAQARQNQCAEKQNNVFAWAIFLSATEEINRKKKRSSQRPNWQAYSELKQFRGFISLDNRQNDMRCENCIFFRHFREIQSRKKETKKDIAKCAKSRKIFRRSFRTGDWLNRAAKMLITLCRRNEIVKSFTNERVAKKIKYRKFWPKRVELTTKMLFLDSQKSPLLTIITVVFSLDKIMRMSNNTRCEWFISNSHSMSSRDVAKYINSTVIFVLHFYSCLPKMSIWQ